MRPGRKNLTSSRADQMRPTSHISLSRVAANGAASAPQRGCRAWGPRWGPRPAGRGGVSRDKRFSPSTPGPPPRGLCAVGWLGRGCSRTGPATANSESPTEVARAPDESSQFLTWCSAMASREPLARHDERRASPQRVSCAWWGQCREYLNEEQRSQPRAPTARTVRRGVSGDAAPAECSWSFHHWLLTWCHRRLIHAPPPSIIRAVHS